MERVRTKKNIGPITLNDKIECVRRELGMRERVYPRWVAAGKMTAEKANKEILTMRAVLDTLTAMSWEDEK